jgi:hypothetical protein
MAAVTVLVVKEVYEASFEEDVAWGPMIKLKCEEIDKVEVPVHMYFWGADDPSPNPPVGYLTDTDGRHYVVWLQRRDYLTCLQQLFLQKSPYVLLWPSKDDAEIFDSFRLSNRLPKPSTHAERATLRAALISERTKRSG